MNYFISSYRATVTMIARAKLIGILSFDSLPEWGGGYSMLGVFYFRIGQVDKCGRRRQSHARGEQGATPAIGTVFRG
jgi:hypothetical protein